MAALTQATRQLLISLLYSALWVFLFCNNGHKELIEVCSKGKINPFLQDRVNLCRCEAVYLVSVGQAQL